MNQFDHNSKKFFLILFSIGLTITLIFFSIPNFIDLNRYELLSNRLDAYNESPSNPDKPNNKPSDNPGTNNGNGNPPNNGNNNGNNNPPNNGNNTPNNGGNNNSGNNNNGNNPDVPSKPEENEPSGPTEEEEKPVETPSGEKIMKATFFLNGSDSIEKNEVTCMTKGDSCEIILPNITRKDGKVIGWNLNANSIEGYGVGTKYTLSKNQYFYAITSKKIMVTFDLNGATSLNYSSVSCDLYNKDTSCSVGLPSIQRNYGTGIGFSTNKDATSSDYGATLSISNNIYLYAISSSNFQATFHANGAFDLSETNKGCKAYNRATSCNISAPSMKQDSYTSIGWNTSSESTSVLYGVGTNIPLSGNMNYYAIRKIDETGFFTNNAYAGLNLINSLRASKGISPLKWSKSLEYSAELRVNEVIIYPNGQHLRPNKTDFYTANDLAYAENWTQSYSNDQNEMHKLFMNSPSHLKTMLSSEYTIVGIAVKYNSKDKLYYWVELFG